jgi:O-antigen ligase
VTGTAIAALSFGTLLGAIAALVATAMTEDRARRRLVRLRAACALVAAALVAASSGLALAMACVALLLSVHSIWLAMREPAPLRTTLDRLTAEGDAAWREEFERPFRAYARRHLPRITRPSR